MKNVNTVVTTDLASIIALGALGVQSQAIAGEKKDVEKCYGVAKAGNFLSGSRCCRNLNA